MVRTTGEQIRSNALKEREVIIMDAKNTASRILNDALISAQKVNIQASNLKQNVNVYKSKVRSLVESELKLLDDIDGEY